MSVETAKEFLARLATDEDLAKTATGLAGPALITLAGQMGYVFSESDLEQAAAGAQDSGTLSEDDLGRVSGGLLAASVYTGGELQTTLPGTQDLTKLSQSLLDPVSGALTTPSRYTR